MLWIHLGKAADMLILNMSDFTPLVSTSRFNLKIALARTSPALPSLVNIWDPKDGDPGYNSPLSEPYGALSPYF